MNRISFVAVAVLAFVAARAEDAPAKPWSNATELGVIVTSGNSESMNFALGNKYAYKWSNAEFLSNAGALRTDSTPGALNIDGVLVEPPKETTAESYFLDGKYRHTVTGDLFWYALAGWNRNRFQGIDSRLFGGGGIGYRFFESDRAKFTGELGVDYTQESPVDGEDRDFAGARGFLAYEQKIGAASKFVQELEVLENLDDTDDLRARSLTSIQASLSTNLALKVAARILYDKQPATETLNDINGVAAPIVRELDELDTILTATLVINF
jgi:putative salt-induced outer membrane protein YdiY